MADPGVVDSCLVRDWPGSLRALYRAGCAAAGLLRSPEQAAVRALFVMTGCQDHANEATLWSFLAVRGQGVLLATNRTGTDPSRLRTNSLRVYAPFFPASRA